MNTNSMTWSIHPDFANSNSVQEPELLKTDLALSAYMGEQIYPFDHAPAGSSAIIPIYGVLFTRSYYAWDMKDISRWIAQARDAENIQEIILCFDSPGGQVNGIVNLYNLIKSVSKVKPVIAYVEGMCCSAAYWLASACDKIIASNPSCEMGSIGVMASFVDHKGALEKLGYKEHILYSSLSTEKNKITDDVLKGEYEAYIHEVLDPLATLFIDSVKASRNIDSKALSGKTFFTEKALELGLIDEVKPFIQDILFSNNNNNNNRFNMATNLENIQRAIGVDAIEMQDGGVFLNEEQLSAINSALAPTLSNEEEPEKVNETEISSRQLMENLSEQMSGILDRIEKLENSPAEDAQGATSDSDFQNTENNHNPWSYAKEL